MRTKAAYILSLIWLSVISFTFPICLGIIYMDITGNSKGYSYNLGAEKSISILFGAAELVIWCLLAVPSYVYNFRLTKKKGTAYLIIEIAFFLILSVICIYMTGGIGEFKRFFTADI